MNSGKSRLRAIFGLGDCPTPASIHLVSPFGLSNLDVRDRTQAALKGKELDII